MIRRDYIERLIEQVVDAVARVLRLREVGDTDRAQEALDVTIDLVLGSYRPLVERLEARAAVMVIGDHEVDRIRMYAALLAEEGALHEQVGELATARLRWRRALELYEAAAAAGAHLDDVDRDRVAQLRLRQSP